MDSVALDTGAQKLTMCCSSEDSMKSVQEAEAESCSCWEEFACPAEEADMPGVCRIGCGGSILLDINNLEGEMPERVTGSCLRKQDEKLFHQDHKSWNLYAAAEAIRRAGELREHVDGVRPFDSVVAWSTQNKEPDISRYEVSWPEDDDNPDGGRFYSLNTTGFDFEMLSLEDARRDLDSDRHIHIGDVPQNAYEACPSVVSDIESRKCSWKFVLTIIELCCSEDSKISSILQDATQK